MTHSAQTTSIGHFMEGNLRGEWIRLYEVFIPEKSLREAERLNNLPRDERIYDKYRVMKRTVLTTVTEEVGCSCGRFHTPSRECICKISDKRH